MLMLTIVVTILVTPFLIGRVDGRRTGPEYSRPSGPARLVTKMSRTLRIKYSGFASASGRRPNR